MPASRRRSRDLAVALGLAMAVAMAAPSSGVGEDAQRPEAHFQLDDPADLSPTRAEEIYQRIRSDLLDAYALSGLAEVEAYGAARRVTTRPYRSEPHGERFVNHWANTLAWGYADPGPPIGSLPAGALLAKDSFTVTAEGAVHVGPLFVMEKMPPGFAPETDDWRYTMVMPDGSLFGRTGGVNARRMTFCARCHATARPDAGGDWAPLFGVPRDLPR